ncbi:ABC transporter substrate-binding protein [Gordonia desulfuricans]|uniref:ABC transporter substrate-binding protein n=1 Tax=Gordonia desulfuricans TaxID=89051 RepID=A0A7K3LQG2_9ACTN|nr:MULTISPECIES: hypothetical protein [Gordonia]EMP11565.1 hypothetical protein ISGA_4479 [Gordonia sp. NB41Y]NDK90504.1 ABC transporter substrate-binding protein [Gordonia desulfuricans]WLP90417.1 hypothetical protein Q9K23_23390 [Gordonia sp. NB41Y]
MKFPKIVGAVTLAAAVMMGVAACGGDSSDDVPTVPQTSSAASTSGAAGAADVTDPKVLPTVAQLNTMLDTALDPDVPNAQKTQLVQGSQKDPDIFDKLVKAREDNPGVTYKILGPVIADGPNKATVKVQIKLPDNPPTPFDAQIVYDGGRWKLASSTVCPLVTGNGIESAMCPTSSTTTKKSTSATN